METDKTQPLDLDKLEALAKAAANDGSKDASWQFAASVNPAIFLALIAQARAAQPVQTGVAVEPDEQFDEQAGFETWARATNQGFESLKGTHDPTGNWYYFDEEPNIAWGAWQARATLAPVAAQQAAAKQDDLESLEGRLRYIHKYGSADLAQAVETGQTPIHIAIEKIKAAAKAPATQAVNLSTVETALKSTLFNECRAIMGTTNWGQDDALRRVLLRLSAQPSELRAILSKIYAANRLRDVRGLALDAIGKIDAAPTAGAATTSEDARDAARYRWLCEKFGVTKLPCALESLLLVGYIADGKESIDAAIDSAMRATQQEGE